jgi:ABC-type xylose transport system permease subunit
MCAQQMLDFGLVGGIAAGILAGALSGALTGFMIAKAKLPPFIMTLGMSIDLDPGFHLLYRNIVIGAIIVMAVYVDLAREH